MYQIDLKGVAAHAGNDHEKGRSAVTELAHWTLALNTLTDYAAGTTVNVGQISGGTASNVVPEHASATIDIRFWKTSEFGKIERALHDLQAQPFTPDVSITLKRLSFMPAMEASNRSADETVEAAGAEMASMIGWKAVGGGSDANHTAALGIPRSTASAQSAATSTTRTNTSNSTASCRASSCCRTFYGAYKAACRLSSGARRNRAPRPLLSDGTKDTVSIAHCRFALS